ncbi:MFS transporter [Amnibacterium flavum]|uniref:MFS transporter n=1 Tax=Amnibacterium flavum TaxID=2173173 RepID=A0A2V1HNZ2_9MICO|nr:MFS transporter [Amnibacterium flavum]PVZ94278.1 MFS transporter [Amnibacterium flavum]
MPSSHRGVVATAVTLLLTSLVGRLPQAMSALAIVRLVLDAGGDYLLASGLTAAYVLAQTVGQPVLAFAVDRTGRPRWIILGAALLAGGAFVLLAATSVELPLVAGAAAVVAGLATPPIEPVLRSLWPRIMTRGTQLSRAFSADAAVQELLFIIGPLVTAVAVALIGADGSVLLMAVLGLIGASAFVLHRELGLIGPSQPERSRPVAADSAGRKPVRTAIAIPGVQLLVAVQVAVGLSVGVLTISATAHSESAGDPALAGWALAINAGGALTGAVLVARFPVRLSIGRALSVLLAVLGVLYLPTAVITAPSPYWLAAAYLSGLTLPPLLTQVFSAVERAAPRERLTEANAWTVSGFSVGIAVGTLGAGLAADAAGFAGTGAAVVVAAVVAIIVALIMRPGALFDASPDHETVPEGSEVSGPEGAERAGTVEDGTVAGQHDA